jgi:molybdopterin-guanine dinucleotide biosynthesis protein A
MSALKSHPDKGWMVVAVDMPFVHAPVLKDLADARNTEKIATCFFNPERSLPEPLLAIWEPTALPVLEAYAAEGMISPQWILQHTDVALAAVRDVKFLLNVNYPTDWPGAIL